VAAKSSQSLGEKGWLMHRMASMPKKEAYRKKEEKRTQMTKRGNRRREETKEHADTGRPPTSFFITKKGKNRRKKMGGLGKNARQGNKKEGRGKFEGLREASIRVVNSQMQST